MIVDRVSDGIPADTGYRVDYSIERDRFVERVFIGGRCVGTVYLAHAADGDVWVAAHRTGVPAPTRQAAIDMVLDHAADNPHFVMP